MLPECRPNFTEVARMQTKFYRSCPNADQILPKLPERKPNFTEVARMQTKFYRSCPNADQILPKLPAPHERSSGSELSDRSVSSNTTCESQVCIVTKKSGLIALSSFEQTRVMAPAARNDLWCTGRKIYWQLCKRRNKINLGKHGEHRNKEIYFKHDETRN